MRIPSNLTSLIDEGLIQDVVRPLMSGKEAEVFLLWAGGELRVAKVYKEAQNRTFKNRAEYTEGRKVRNSRDQRAMDKRSRHGRAQDEAAWRSTEVDMIYRLQSAGVRVPKPHHAIDGVFIMEMVADADGSPAPRLAEVSLDPAEARGIFDRLLAEVVRMLCADIVHGDLSDFNVLMAADGPVIIDFPQSVDASKNQNARKLLLRDVDNLQRFLARFVPGHVRRPYGEEMWDLYANSLLTPETKLTGRHRVSERRADTRAVLDLIGDANYDERKRRERQGLSMRGAPSAAHSPAPEAPPHRPQHAERPGPQGGNATGPRMRQDEGAQRPPQHGGEHRSPQHGGGQRSPQHGSEQRSPQHTGGQRPPQHGGGQRAPQHGGEHRSPQHAGAQRSPQHGGEHRSPQHAGAQRSPQHGGEHRSPQHGDGQRSPQHGPDRHAGHAGHGSSPRPPRQEHDAGQPRPSHGAAQRPEPVEAPPSPPRRRVIVTVSTTQRRPGSRRTP